LAASMFPDIQYRQLRLPTREVAAQALNESVAECVAILRHNKKLHPSPLVRLPASFLILFTVAHVFLAALARFSGERRLSFFFGFLALIVGKLLLRAVACFDLDHQLSSFRMLWNYLPTKQFRPFPVRRCANS
jgi:hypothetical protein